MKVLVTGASGFIGQHLTNNLLESGISVRVVTRDTNKLPLNWSSRVEIVCGCLTEARVQKECVRDISIIFNLAGELNNPALMKIVNIEVLRNIVHLAAQVGVKRIIHLSSVGVMGEKIDGVITEKSSCNPTNEYERTKLVGEKVFCDAIKVGVIEGVIIRPTIVFGEGIQVPHDSFLEWLRVVQEGRFVFLGNHGVANYVYVGDLVHVLRKMAEASSLSFPLFIFADSTPMQNFVKAMAYALDVPMPTKCIPVALGYCTGFGMEIANRVLGTPAPLTRRRVRALTITCIYSCERLTKAMGISLPFGYQKGIQRTVLWHREKGALL